MIIDAFKLIESKLFRFRRRNPVVNEKGNAVTENWFKKY